MRSSPRVSIVIGSYRASETIDRCLASLRAQTFRDFEVVLTDSTPDDSVAVIAGRYPEVNFEHAPARLYCHEARNRGVERARGELIACLDADVYASPDWLGKLVNEYDATRDVIVGAIDCWGTRLRDRAMHLCKFNQFLPGGPPRPIETGPTANLLVARADFDAVGGLNGDRYVADVEFGRALQRLGRTLRFAPDAVVAHHHTQPVGEFLRERFIRGAIYGRIRGRWLTSRRKIAVYLAVSILPVRLLRILVLTARQASAARALVWFLLAWPLVAAGHISWLFGEAVSYARLLVSPRS